MTDFFESEDFTLPSEMKSNLAQRLKEKDAVHGLEFRLKGEALENAREFGAALVALRRRGVKVSHDVSIRLEFPKPISKEKTLGLVESLPKPKNGFLKVRVELGRRETPSKSQDLRING